METEVAPGTWGEQLARLVIERPVCEGIYHSEHCFVDDALMHASPPTDEVATCQPRWRRVIPRRARDANPFSAYFFSPEQPDEMKPATAYGISNASREGRSGGCVKAHWDTFGYLHGAFLSI